MKRRDFIRKTAYVVPAIITLSAVPALASTGSPHKPHPHNGKAKSENRHGGLHRLWHKFSNLW